MLSLFKKNRIKKCPYCGIVIEKDPTRKFKCPSCKGEIFLKGENGIVRLLSKDDYELQLKKLKAKQEENMYLKFFQNYLLTEKQLLKRKEEWFQKFGDKASYSDLTWSVANDLLDSYAKLNEFHDMKMIYFQMALLEKKNNREFFHLLQESTKMELLEYKKNRDVIKKVEILSAGEDSCEICNKLNGKRFTIDDALEKMPIPTPDCTNEIGYCRCLYVAVT
jgi:predicted RNA-binding Zn-ribbon protein involved in translation (DUF1610 family)